MMKYGAKIVGVPTLDAGLYREVPGDDAVDGDEIGSTSADRSIPAIACIFHCLGFPASRAQKP